MAILETDPLDVKLADDGDLDTSNGTLEFVSGKEGVAQLCRIALQMIKGEWFLDLDAGMPWQESDTVTEADALLGGKFDELKVRAAVRTALLSAPGVSDITLLAVEFSARTRELEITWRVRTAFGDTEAETTPI